ncbi:hypothetical protein GIB67_006684 [Kingdonia uniflora]|uniref:Uncharacterized protein n=1 Tax=Kingdonia uniflora TaxID=39325 RepID=A0A7J7LAN8_9MAGN|nr:hypothetical protein GIB67_006684 [Kingdonia uniflora]
MISTRDCLKQTKEKLLSLLKIHRKPNSKKKGNLEKSDSEDRLTTLEMKVFDRTTTLGELVEQLRLTNLVKASASIKRRGRSKKKSIVEGDGDEGTEEIYSNFSDAESVKERSGAVTPSEEGFYMLSCTCLADNECSGVGFLGIAWAFGGMIFVLVYCTAGGHINPAATFGLFLARKVSLIRVVMYIVAQSLGAICDVALVKAFQSAYYDRYAGGTNVLAYGYSKRTGLAAEIIGTFVLVYTVFSVTNPKRSARDSHVPARL